MSHGNYLKSGIRSNDYWTRGDVVSGRWRRLTVGSALLTVVLGGLPGTAVAGNSALGEPLLSTAASSESCNAPIITEPFARFGDFRDYVQVPEGSFEAPQLDGWRLSGGASRVAESDPVDLGAGDGLGLLALPPGASAISPVMCIDLDYPTGRLLSRALPGSAKPALTVEIIYPDGPKKTTWQSVSRLGALSGVDAGAGWRLSPDLHLKPRDGGKTAGFRPVAFRVTASAGSWRVDDFYIDPRCR